MKKTMQTVALVVACGLAVAGAASTAHAERGTVGFGTSLDLRLGTPVSLGNVLVPIHVSEQFMVEPEFGFLRTAAEQGDDNESDLNLRLGVGFLYKDAITKDVNIYGGLRLGVNYLTGSEETGGSTRDTSQTNFWVGGVSGGEYFLNNAFSVGGEWGFYFLSVGEPSVTVEGEEVTTDGEDQRSQSAYSTSTMIVVRWYFL